MIATHHTELVGIVTVEEMYRQCVSFNCQYILRVILLHELTACGSVSQLLSPGHCITIAYTCSCLNCILQPTVTCIWYKQQMVPSFGPYGI